MLNLKMVNCLPEFCSFSVIWWVINWISVDLPYMRPTCLSVSRVTVIFLTNLQADFLFMVTIFTIYEAYQDQVFMWWCISLFLARTDWFSSSSHLIISSYMVQFLMGLVWIVWFRIFELWLSLCFALEASIIGDVLLSKICEDYCKLFNLMLNNIII